MSEGRLRVAVMFDLGRGGLATQQRVAGIHRYAGEQGGRWLPVADLDALRREDVRYDGVVGPGSRAIAEAARAAGVPYVGATCEVIAMRFPRAIEHRRRAGVLVARHLGAHAYRHFALLGYHHHSPSRLLEEGFRSAARKFGGGITMDLHSVRRRRRPATRARFRRHLAGWLAGLPKPVGLVAIRVELARVLAQLCLDAGLRVPEEVGIVAAGDDPAVCLAPPVPLTAVDFRYETVGYRAAAYLDELMAAGRWGRGNVYVEPHLVARASTAREFEDDAVVAEAVAFIRERCHEPLTVGAVASAVGLSARQLLRRFTLCRHHSVVREVVLARLARARELLRTTALPVGEVARACGYADGSRLRKVFERFERCTPRAWRRGQGWRLGRRIEPLEHAKQQLETTDNDLGFIALLCGFRTARRLRAAFLLQEGMPPEAWRRRYRQPPRVPSRPRTRPRMIVRFIGPDGEVEDEQRFPQAADAAEEDAAVGAEAADAADAVAGG